MEGTSGAADLGLLRGRTGEAALGPRCVRASDASRAVVLRGASQDVLRRPPAGGLAQAGRRGSAGSYPSRGWGSCGGIVKGVVPSRARRPAAPESPAGGATVSRREVSERIGSGKALFGPAAKRPGEGGLLGESRWWACRMRLRPSGPWPVKPRLVAADRRRGASASCSQAGGGCPSRCQGCGRLARLRPSLAVRTPGGGASERLRSLFCAAIAGESRRRRAGRVERASARTPGSLHARRRSGGPAVVLAGWLVAEVDERRWVHGRETAGLALWLPRESAGSSRGENAPEAGSRWRKPRAHEQRHRWRAPRDPTRRRESVVRARGREHSSMEGALARQEQSPLTRRPRAPGRAARGDGDAVAIPDPPRVAARGRQRSCRELGTRSNTPRPGGAAQRSRDRGSVPGLRCATHVNAQGPGPGRALGAPRQGIA